MKRPTKKKKAEITKLTRAIKEATDAAEKGDLLACVVLSVIKTQEGDIYGAQSLVPDSLAYLIMAIEKYKHRALALSAETDEWLRGYEP